MEMRMNFKQNVMLIMCKPLNYDKLIKKIIKSLNGKTIYIALNKPHNELTSSSKFFFIDSLTKKCSKNCTYFENPGSLTQLSIILSDLIEKKKFDYLVIDSLSAMLSYNSNDMVNRFIRYLVNKMRMFGIKVIMVALDSRKEKELFDNICQIANKCIKF